MSLPLPLFAVTGALLVLTGVAALAAPEESAERAEAPARLPVERSSLLCPTPGNSDLAETAYSSFTPVVKGAEDGGRAQLVPAERKSADDGADTGKDDERPKDDSKDDAKDDPKDGDGKDRSEDGKGDRREDSRKGEAARDGGAAPKPVLDVKEPGKPVEHQVSGGSEPALIGTAEGRLAPGWTVQQTTEVAAGTGRGISGVTCSAPDTDFWFPAVSTAESRSDYVHVTNPDDSAAIVDIELYGPDGQLKSQAGEDIQVPPHGSVPLLLSTLSESAEETVTAHVAVRSGRVSAAVHSADDELGGDWLPAAGAPAGSLVLPGLPKDTISARLVIFAPGEDDADLRLRLATPTGSITPAGHESLHVKAGMTASTDLPDITRGQPGSLLLEPTDDSVPVVAAVRIVRGNGGKQETAFIPASPAVGDRASVAGNHAKGTSLSLVAPGEGAKVRVTASAGSEGGTSASEVYTVKRGSTLAVTPPRPEGLKGTYALTVERVSGGAVYASRMYEAPEDGVPMFTVQTLSDDRGTVSVPEAAEDLSVVQGRPRD
ncbi:hypothetical protein HUT18_11040 [Streptomyces sp. NA04227]|nr:hypothetical protein HUT18_11040 [Streptomyces sp. NA04227]